MKNKTHKVILRFSLEGFRKTNPKAQLWGGQSQRPQAFQTRNSDRERERSPRLDAPATPLAHCTSATPSAFPPKVSFQWVFTLDISRQIPEKVKFDLYQIDDQTPDIRDETLLRLE